MSIASFVVSSLLSLVALVDSDPTSAICINSTIVKNVMVAGANTKQSDGYEGLKEKWIGSCGPIQTHQVDQLNLIRNWFVSRGLKSEPIDIYLTRDGSFQISEKSISLPLELLSQDLLLNRLLTKSLLLQNALQSGGLGWEIANDLVLADIFGEPMVKNQWQLDGFGIYGELSTLSRDCAKNFVPLEIQKSTCTRESIHSRKQKISPWGYRWIVMEAFGLMKADHNVKTRVDISKRLFEIAKKIQANENLDSYLGAIEDVNQTAKILFEYLDSPQDCFDNWKRDYSQLQVLLTHSFKNLNISSPLPQNTLVLDFNSGFRFITGEAVDLDEAEVFKLTKRVALIDCEGPTVSEILQYSGTDKRLIFVENCDLEKPLRLGKLHKFGTNGLEQLNPQTRFLQFHQPSVRLALDWGLTANTSFGFGRDPAQTPAKLRRLFGWNRDGDKKTILAPLPIIDVFNIQKGEVLVLKGDFQSDQNEDFDTSQLSEKKNDSEEQKKNIF